MCFVGKKVTIRESSSISLLSMDFCHSQATFSLKDTKSLLFSTTLNRVCCDWLYISKVAFVIVAKSK